MNTYQVIMARWVSPEVGNILESIPSIRANYFEVEEVNAQGEGGVLAKFWTLEGEAEDHVLTAVVTGFLAIIKTGEEGDGPHPLGDSYPTP